MLLSRRISVFVFLGLASSPGYSESAYVPLKSDQTLPYKDMYGFSYAANGTEAIWLLIPPYLQDERDLPNALFQLNSRGMTAELLKTPLPDLAAPSSDADGHERKMQLQTTAALGLLATVRQSADYGTALTARLKEKALADSGSATLKQKMLLLSLGNGSSTPTPVSPPPDGNKPRLYDDSVPLAEAKIAATALKLEVLERMLKGSVNKRQIDIYERAVSALLALQEEGQEAGGQASRILAGYHVNGLLRGFPADELVDVVFPTSFLESWDAYDLLDLNKIIMLSGTSKDKSALTASLMLLRASVEQNPEDRYLMVSGILGRLLSNESVDSLVLDISKLSYFGSTTDQVKRVLQDLMKLWKR